MLGGHIIQSLLEMAGLVSTVTDLLLQSVPAISRTAITHTFTATINMQQKQSGLRLLIDSNVSVLGSKTGNKNWHPEKYLSHGHQIAETVVEGTHNTAATSFVHHFHQENL